MTHIHGLDGCAPIPLAHYLKALGILRLVSEQVDRAARGWWEGDRFRLTTTLSQLEVERFLLSEYAPTALVAPWNKGSGFFYDNDAGLTPVEHSTAARFQRIRAGIADSRPLLNELTQADAQVRSIKDEAKNKELSRLERSALKNSPTYKKRLAEAERRFKAIKRDLIPSCRMSWRGSQRQWLDAAVVLDDNGAPKFPALLGTGGNDGRLDFTNNYLQRLGDLFDLASATGGPRAETRAWLRAALWDVPATGYQDNGPVGQYLPGGAGGANSGNGPEGRAILNPFDFVLALEGSVVFRAHATVRLGAHRGSRAAAPFVVGAQGAGYQSAGESDESARGEQWMPLWSQPLLLAELHHLLGEGRAQIGRRDVREAFDLALAVARIGTARGVSSFQRYAYIERNGQSNLAVPLGRFWVPDRIAPQLLCLDDLHAWLTRLRREARGPGAPARLKQAERRLFDALFAVTHHPKEASRWQGVLLALAAVEAVMVTGSGFAAGPIPPLGPEWVRAAHDGTDPVSAREMRLALSVALQRWRDRPTESGPVWPDTVRRHWLPLNRSGRGFATSGAAGQQRLEIRSEVVLNGRSGEDDAIDLLSRRFVEASQRGERRLPLVASWGAAAAPSDLGAVLAGEVSLDRTMRLARALMALDPRRWQHNPERLPGPPSGNWPDDGWLTIRLALLPWASDDTRRIGSDPAILRRLAAGDAPAALQLSLRRLQVAGVMSTVRMTNPGRSARRWAAALAFPISRSTARRFIERLDRSVLASPKELNS